MYAIGSYKLYKVCQKVGEVIVSGNYAPSDDLYYWNLPELPPSLSIDLPQKFQTAEAAASAYNYYISLIKEKKIGFSWLQKEAEKIAEAVKKDSSYWAKKSDTIGCTLNLVKTTDWLRHEPIPTEYEVHYAMYFCYNGFKSTRNPKECVKQLMVELVSRQINPNLLGIWLDVTPELLSIAEVNKARNERHAAAIKQFHSCEINEKQFDALCDKDNKEIEEIRKIISEIIDRNFKE